MIKFSAIDNDLYKFTMQQAAQKLYPDAWVKYRYKCRNPHIFGSIDVEKFQKNVSELITEFCQTRFQHDELQFMSHIPFLKPHYIDFLEDFTFKQRYIHTKNVKEGIELYIEGPWVQTILFEVPLLYIISESYTRCIVGDPTMASLASIKAMKEAALKYLHPRLIGFTDFGTRRRATQNHQYLMLEAFANHEPFNMLLTGTSNLLYAKQLNLPYRGTQAHEWGQAHQALFRVSESQKAALDAWVQVYRGDLGIALSDVVGFKAFLRDFDKYFANLYDGCRQDSGDPYWWGDLLIRHYEDLGIEPKTKHAIFSDGLDFEQARDLDSRFKGKFKSVGYGIGTAFTNNLGFEAPNIVIKMVECNRMPVAKVSDSKGKGMCEDENHLNYVNQVFSIS